MPSSVERKRQRRGWAQLIRSVFEVDPLLCTCGATMRTLSLSDRSPPWCARFSSISRARALGSRLLTAEVAEISGRVRLVPDLGTRSPTLDTTALAHEAYLELASAEALSAKDRAHFLAAAGRAMRQTLVDYVRVGKREKRGGGAVHLELEKRDTGLDSEIEQILVLEEALSSLEPGLGRIVECRHFAGMTGEETAEALALSLRTVQRGWEEAKATLRRVLAPG